MRIHKTNQKDRSVYKYTTTERTEKGAYVEKTIKLKPGENGVTELDIKILHSMDDSEVYYNLKNARPERTKEEKAEIEVWKQKFVGDFKERHGYEPNKYIIKDAVNSDKESVEMFEWSERMEEVLSLLTDKQRLVINLMFVEEYKQSEIADLMSISSDAVKKHLDKAKEIIKNNF